MRVTGNARARRVPDGGSSSAKLLNGFSAAATAAAAIATAAAGASLGRPINNGPIVCGRRRPSRHSPSDVTRTVRSDTRARTLLWALNMYENAQSKGRAQLRLAPKSAPPLMRSTRRWLAELLHFARELCSAQGESCASTRVAASERENLRLAQWSSASERATRLAIRVAIDCSRARARTLNESAVGAISIIIIGAQRLGKRCALSPDRRDERRETSQ